MDQIFLGADRSLRFDATNEDDQPVTDATVVITVYDVQTGEDAGTPPVTSTSNRYTAVYRNEILGTFRAIAEATDAGHVGVEIDEWRVIDPRESP